MLVIRMVVLLLALAVPVAAAGAPAGVPLWEGAKTGMGLTRVLALFPEARRVEPAEEARATVERRGRERARIPMVEIGGDGYRARFFFKDGLFRVVLERPSAEGLPFSKGLKLTEQVREALTAKYGEPEVRQSSNDGYMVSWRNGGTAIELVVITQTYKVKAFKIVYKPAEGGDAAE
jgi:hypothetical protein